MTDHRARAKEAWAKLGEVLKAAKRVHPHDNKAMALFVDEAATNQLTALCREVERETWEQAARFCENEAQTLTNTAPLLNELAEAFERKAIGKERVIQLNEQQAAQGKEEG